jgi:CDP-diacylglycerol--glycerol-3-phosphate 3-phosphatidyltransferase
LNLPNTLTLTRIFLTPLLVVILLTRVEGKEIYGLVIFTLAALTDYFDGYFARKRNQVTATGKLLDPIADKLLITAAFISLVELELAPAWMVVIIICREFVVTGLRSIAATRGLIMPANWLGKTKTFVQVCAIIILILADTYIEPWLRFGRYLLWAAVVISLVSMASYTVQFLRLGESKLRVHPEEETKYDQKQPGKEKIIS